MKIKLPHPDVSLDLTIENEGPVFRLSLDVMESIHVALLMDVPEARQLAFSILDMVGPVERPAHVEPVGSSKESAP